MPLLLSPPVTRYSFAFDAARVRQMLMRARVAAPRRSVGRHADALPVVAAVILPHATAAIMPLIRQSPALRSLAAALSRCRHISAAFTARPRLRADVTTLRLPLIHAAPRSRHASICCRRYVLPPAYYAAVAAADAACAAP
jgi:hypothetical protein